MIYVFAIICLFAVLVSASAAQQRRRALANWFLLGAASPAPKVCPDCQGTVPGMARVCMHCGYRFASLPTPPAPPPMRRWSSKERRLYVAQYRDAWGVWPAVDASKWPRSDRAWLEAALADGAAIAIKPALPPPDMRKWSKRDREAYERQQSRPS